MSDNGVMKGKWTEFVRKLGGRYRNNGVIHKQKDLIVANKPVTAKPLD